MCFWVVKLCELFKMSKQGEKNKLPSLAKIALGAALQASEAILGIYDSGFAVEAKCDGSPITDADKIANGIILDSLSKTDIPVISEETLLTPFEERCQWEYFWLVDPLDGTREFIERNGEFTVNIALMHHNRPVMGVIVAPVWHQAWWGIVGDGGVYHISDIHRCEATTSFIKNKENIEEFDNNQAVRIGVSRSHIEQQTRNLISQMQEKGISTRTVAIGSSLKFGLLSTGDLEMYLRYSPTHEWDIGAGHAILLAAGGEVFNIHLHEPLSYNKPNLKNPGIIAFARKEEASAYFKKLAF